MRKHGVAAHSRRADVIDIGINQIVDNDGHSRIVGDVDTDNVKEVASWLTPVPGGVGPVTVAMFMCNAVEAYCKQLAAGWLDTRQENAYQATTGAG